MSIRVDEIYKKSRKRKYYFLYGSILLLIIVVFLSLCLGSTSIGLRDVYALLTGRASDAAIQIIVNMRLPRIVAALLCGWALALSGSIMQIILKNPLASPYTLGISNAAAFGASLAIVFGSFAVQVPQSGDLTTVINPYAVTLCAFACSFFALFIILFIMKSLNHDSHTIILSGIIISSIFAAALSGIQYIASSSQLASIVFWTFGDLSHARWPDLLLIFVILLPISICLYYFRWSYRAISAGDECATSCGVNPGRPLVIGLVLTTVCASVVVSFFGVIAFIGLVVPHIVRKCIGNNEEFLIIGSAIIGAVFLLICDTLGRTILSPIILPVGIITSIVGAPFFLILLLNRKKNDTYYQ